MEKYESVIIINTKLTKNKLNELILQVEDNINKFAKIVKKEDYGIKKLAYEVRKNKEGHYLIYQFEINKDNKNIGISEIERFYKNTDEIIKYITVKV